MAVEIYYFHPQVWLTYAELQRSLDSHMSSWITPMVPKEKQVIKYENKVVFQAVKCKLVNFGD